MQMKGFQTYPVNHRGHL